MISHVIFGTLALVYYVLRFLFRALFQTPRRRALSLKGTRAALITAAEQHGGRILEDSRNLQWILPDGASAELQRQRRPRLLIRIPAEFPVSITFQRLPRLAYAFLEAFLAAENRAGDLPYYVTASDSSDWSTLRNQPDVERILDELSREGYSVRIGPHGLTAWKRPSGRETSDLVLYEQIRLVRDLARICSRVDIPVQAVPSLERCAYCHEISVEDPGVIYCGRCRTPHHRECFDINGGCSVFGCNSIRPAESAQLAR